MAVVAEPVLPQLPAGPLLHSAVAQMATGPPALLETEHRVVPQAPLRAREYPMEGSFRL